MTDADWRDGGFRKRRPFPETLVWVAASMGRGSRIVGYRRLTGGVCSTVHRLTVERRGKRTFVVLRQYPGGLGLEGSMEKEIANLRVVAGSGVRRRDGPAIPETRFRDADGRVRQIRLTGRSAGQARARLNQRLVRGPGSATEGC